MAQTPESHAQVFLNRKRKNLEFFKKMQSGMGSFFENLQMRRLEVVVDPDQPDLDLTEGGQSLYGSRAREAARNEVDQFLGAFGKPARLLTYRPYWKDQFQRPRFGDQALLRSVEPSPVTPENFQGYHIDRVIPHLVFVGVGLGYHIEELLKRVDVVRAVIYEPDPEAFAASLFTVDWPSIVEKFSQTKGKTLSFVVGTGQPKEQLERQLHATVCGQVPYFPFLTVFFNHRGLERGKELVLQSRSHAKVVLSSWGSYDNELLRINNSRHNLGQPFDYLVNDSRTGNDKPVAIVGSGPSLDERMADLKAHRDQLIIVSAGTGIRALIKNGIKPDYHVELDPILLVYEMHRLIGKEGLRDTVLLAANEVHPWVARLFGRTLYYFRQDSHTSVLLGAEEGGFQACTPTCVNAAVSIFAQLGFSQLLLFGVDFGYADPEQHHARQSVYGIESSTDYEKSLRLRSMHGYKDSNTFEVESVTGGKVTTRSQYYAARDFLVAQIRNHAARRGEGAPLDIRNCSDGAVINGAPWIQRQDFPALMEQMQPQDRADPSLKSRTGDATRVRAQIDTLAGAIEARTDLLQKLTAGIRLKGEKDLLLLVSRMMDLLEAKDARGEEKYGRSACLAAYHMLRGTLWRFLTIGLTHGLAVSGQEQHEFLKEWHGELEGFLKQVPGHFRGVVCREDSADEDVWLRQYLSDPEDLDRKIEPPVA